jgi:methionyl-tRNA synthetase
LLNRTLNMAGQFGLERLSSRPTDRLELNDLAGKELTNVLQKNVTGMESYRIDHAIEMAFALSGHCNIVIDFLAPWKLRKKPNEKPLLEAILYHLADSLRIIAILISPVAPTAAHGIFDQLNWKMELRGKEERFLLADAEWGKLPDGHVVGKPVPLFPRIEGSGD